MKRVFRFVGRLAYRLVVFAVGVYLLVFFAVMVVLNSHAVQDALLPLLVDFASEKLGARVEIGGIHLKLFDEIALDSVAVYDQHNRPIARFEEFSIGVLNLSFIDFLRNTDKPRSIGASSISLKNAEVNLVRSPARVWNFGFIAERFRDTTQPEPAKRKLTLDFPDVALENLRFQFLDSASADTHLLASEPFFFNPRNFLLVGVNVALGLQLDAFQNLSVDIDKVQALEQQSGIQVKHASGQFSGYTDSTIYDVPGVVPSVLFSNMNIELNDSKLDFDLVMDDELVSTLFLRHNRNVDIEFRPSRLDLAAISYWVRNKMPLRGVFEIEGRVVGDYAELASQFFRLKYSDGTELNLAFLLRHYVRPDSLWMQLEFDPSNVDLADAKAVLPQLELPPQLMRASQLAFTGNFMGTLNDFKTQMQAQTPLGGVEADLHMFVSDTLSNAYSYDVSFTTNHLRLDSLLGIASSSDLNASGHVSGVGFTLAEMAAKANVSLANSDVMGFRLDSVKASVGVLGHKLEGNIHLADAQGDFNGRVVYDFSGDRDHYEFYGDVQNLNLLHYGITDTLVLLSSYLNLNLAGDSLDVLEGYARAFELELEHPRANKPLRLSQVELSVDTDGPVNKSFVIDSEWLSFWAEGQFRYIPTIRKFSEFAKEINLFLKNDTAEIRTYYAAKAPATDVAQFHFGLGAKKLTPLLAFVNQGIAYVQPGDSVTGNINFSGDQRLVAVQAYSDSMAFGNQGVRGLSLNTTLHKKPMENHFWGSGVAGLRQFALTSDVVLHSIQLATQFENNRAAYTLNAFQQQPQNHLRLVGTTVFANNVASSHIEADSSFVLLSDSVWRFGPDNRLVVGEGELLLLDDFNLSHGSQSIAITGALNVPEQENEDVFIRLHDLNLNFINNFIANDFSYSGLVNADFHVIDVFARPVVELNGRISGFVYQAVEVGELMVASDYEQANQLLRLNVALVKERDSLLTVGGTYSPFDTLSPLRFQVTTDRLPISLIQPFVNDYLYDVSGNINISRVFLTGQLMKPKLQGIVTLDNVAVGVRYLAQKFYIDQDLKLTDSLIAFKHFEIYDGNPRDANARAQRLELNGQIAHNGFSNLWFGLRLSVARDQRFRVMNTLRSENPDFYGRAVIAGGNASLTGPPSLLDIQASFAAGDGTQINIPLESYTENERLEYVRFIGAETGSLADSVDLGITGINLHLEVEAQPNAEIRLIFDERTGDIIRARGSGIINLDITRAGEFLMTGNYEIVQGGYMFTFRNIINKEFRVQPGSTISWDGDATSARMNITAIYEREVSLSSLDTTLAGTRPVQVVLTMTGDFQNPVLDFSINIPNVSQDQGYRITSRLAYIQSDEAEFNRQVFSLLLLNQFAPIGGFLGGGGAGGVGSSVSEFLSNQLNNLIGASLRTNDINFRLETAQEVVNLALKLNVNDRITIERNGTLVGGRRNDMALGNINITIKILPAPGSPAAGRTGELVAVVFNRENVVSNSMVGTNRGVGLFYRREFDTLADLLRRRRLVPGPHDAPPTTSGN